METVSAGSPSILTDSRSFNNLNQVYRAAYAHKDMFHTKLPAVERDFINYTIFRTFDCASRECVSRSFLC